MQPEVGTAAEQLDHVAEDRQPGISHHGLEIAAAGVRLQACCRQSCARSRFSTCPMPGMLWMGV
jgi:hypothetical protein